MSTVAVPSDLEMAQQARLLPVVEVARRLGLTDDDIDLYGKYKAKIHLDVLDRLTARPTGKYIRGEAPAGDARRSSRWRTSTCTSRATRTPWGRRTTCWPR